MSAKSISALLLLLLANLAHAQEFEKTLTRYVWLGGVTNSSFELRIDIEPDETALFVTSNAKFDNETVLVRFLNAHKSIIPHDPEIYGNLRNFTVSGLKPLTKYFIHIFNNATNSTVLAASVKTFPELNSSNEIVVGLGSCQIRARDAQALNELSLWNRLLAEQSPSATFFMLHMGDLHYGDIRQNSTKLFERATRNVNTDFLARNLFTTVPVAYMPDDHDFGGNNAGARSRAKEAAQANFRNMIPTPTLPGSELFYSFTVGAVRFILTDLRSMATRAKDGVNATALGASQHMWLNEELKRANDFDVVVWMSTRPWIAKARSGSDTWGGFAEERREIANLIADHSIDNLVMVSGDAHMIAADDGTHSMYADNETMKGFPVFQAAPLANFGSSKGGPYTEGCKAYRVLKNFQYALLTISKPVDGNASVTFKGYTVSGTKDYKRLRLNKPILSLRVTRPFGAKKSVFGGGQGSCSIKLAPWWYFFAIVAGFVLFGLVMFYCSYKGRARRKARMVSTVDPDADATGRFGSFDQQQQQLQEQHHQQ